jgi:transcription termination factor NusB
MRACGFCKFLDGDKCKKGYPIERFEKLDGYKRPKYCTKKVDSVKKQKESKDSFLNKKLDNLWSKVVRSKGECELCGRKPPEVVLHAHHIFSRRWYSTRWDIKNGVCLCTGDHLFKAHKDVQEFSDWVQDRYGVDYIDDLRRKAHETADFTKEQKKELINNLQKMLDNL